MYTKELEESLKKIFNNGLCIIEDNSKESLEKLEIIKKILINEENAGKSDLHNYFLDNLGRNAIHKPLRYFDLYERTFSKFRGKDINLLEIGVQNGGSTKMWKYYFSKVNPKAKVNIYGVDIDERCRSIEEDGIKIFIGSQSDRNFLRKLKSEIPKVDILIDDGGHTMEQQIVTFEEMFDHIKDDGVYWCEDIGTSYFKEYGGGYNNPNSYIEFTKKLIDSLNAYYSQDSNLKPNNFTNSTYGIHYYNCVVVIEKKKRDEIYNIASDVVIGNNIFF